MCRVSLSTRIPLELAAAQPVRVSLQPVFRSKQPAPLAASTPEQAKQDLSPALPISKDQKQRLEIARWQVALERRHFSCGTIEGDWGMRSHRAVSHFQRSEGLAVTGELDAATKLRLGEPDQPFVCYKISQEDMQQVAPTPPTWKAKSQLTYLGYSDGWEMAAEKFHTTTLFLQQLNPKLTSLEQGTLLTAPNVHTLPKLPKIGAIHILLNETTLLLHDSQNRLVGCFPCSIAADKRKRPDGALSVIVLAPHPNYTFNPELFPEVAAKEGITHKLLIPPGPNNPVGMAWIGLSLPGYGIHGTPDPSAISRTGSKGCFRLANWNVLQIINLVHKGTPVLVED